MNEFRIKDRVVSNYTSPLVIAEIGINHEGSLKIAKEMIDSAIKAGAEVIKHQTHIVEDEMSEEAKKVIPGNSNDSIYDIMDRCSLSERDEFEMMKYVEKKGAIFISTPFSRKAVDRLEKSEISKVIVCNTSELKENAKFSKLKIINVANVFGESIKRIVEGDSLSSMFKV